MIFEPLNITQIIECYPDEWVLLGNPVRDGKKIISGIPIFNGKDKIEVHKHRNPLLYECESSTIIHTGEFESLYKEKHAWMKNNIPILAKKFDYKCQRCDIETTSKNGTIHHLKYTGFDYQKSVERLLKTKSILWVCKDCHKREHTALNINEVNQKIKHSGNCLLCLDFTWRAWFTKPSLELPICKNCFKYIEIKGMLVEKKEEIYFDEETIKQLKDLFSEDELRKGSYHSKLVLGYPFDLNEDDKKLFFLIQKRIDKGVFGNVKTNNLKNINPFIKRNNQIDLF